MRVVNDTKFNTWKREVDKLCVAHFGYLAYTHWGQLRTSHLFSTAQALFSRVITDLGNSVSEEHSGVVGRVT